jgi:hypothetical protein
MAHDRVVDIPRYDQDERIGRLPEGSFDPGGIEQAERDVECLTEASVGVVMDFAGVHDDADPQLPFLMAETRKAGVVVGEEPVRTGTARFSRRALGTWSTGRMRARMPSPRSTNWSRW